MFSSTYLKYKLKERTFRAKHDSFPEFGRAYHRRRVKKKKLLTEFIALLFFLASFTEVNTQKKEINWTQK